MLKTVVTIMEGNITVQLVPAGDPQALAAALEYVCNSVEVRNRFGRVAKELALFTFDINSTVDNLLKVYEEVIVS